MRHAVLAATAALTLSTTAIAAPATSPTHRPHCSPACVARVQARVHRAHVRARYLARLRTIRPYLSWLRSTGACESGTDGNLHHGLTAIGGGGAFRGRYQFSIDTWQRAGGTGDPAAASWLEQAYRAVRWRQRIGNPHTTAGWPVCG